MGHLPRDCGRDCDEIGGGKSMNIIGKLKEAASYFLTKLIGENPSNEQVNRALIQMPNVRPIHTYPRPNLRNSGVAAAKRAARKRKNRR
ncbi:hypothetical protein [Neisseria meningitidis]|nr:hypothetical protein [Neisseria meningitidis]